MAESISVSGINKIEKYESLIPQIQALVSGEKNFIANVANIMSALKYGMDFFWVGVYFVQNDELVLGPFQGTVACTRIAKGKGVCGTAWVKKETIIVDDVDKFPGHIACSSESKSEIVVPALDNEGNVFMILDVDSDTLSGFDHTDKNYLQQIVQVIEHLPKN